jgi:hypothetical protein
MAISCPSARPAVFPILIIIWGLGVGLEPFQKKKPK